MESIQSKLLKIILKVTNKKKMWEETGDELKKSITKRQSHINYEPPEKLKRDFNINKMSINSHCYYVIKPLKNVGQKHIIYLHGGGFVYNIMPLHWKFICKLVRKLNCTITVPLYPLAPGYQYSDVYDMLLPLYHKIISKVNHSDLVVMGDSAGGAISLSLVQFLKEKNLPQPKNIILISPALDMSLTNPKIHEVEKLDPLLSVPALIDINKWYSGDKNSKHYLISPLYGDVAGLGKISLFTGTHDILNPDAKRFKSIAEDKGVKIDYYEYPSMIHVFPLLFFPESKKATKQIIEIIMSS